MIQGFINLDKEETQHNDQHRKLFTFSLGLIDKTFTSVPTLSQLPVGYFAKYISGSVRKLYFNFDGVLTSITLTNV